MAKPATAIIGAGIVGCLVARELAARDQEASIAVLDRDAVGTGASRRSAGVHVPRGATPRTRHMSAYSHAYYTSLRRTHPDVPIYPFEATVVSAATGSDGPGHSDGAGRDRPGGGYLDAAAAALASGVPDPAVCLPRGARAWHITGCHYADVHRLAQAVAAQLRPRVRFCEGVAVTGISIAPGAVTVTCGTGDQFTVNSVVLAPGPWLSNPAWRDLIAPLGLRVKKIVALHIEQRPGPSDEAVFFDDDDAFLLPVTHRGHWLFSYACQEWDVDPDELTMGLSGANITAARDCLRRYSPALAEKCSSGRVFCDAYSLDREPQVQALDEDGRVVFAGGASGSGYRLAPAIAAQVAELLHLPQDEGVPGDHQYV